MMKKLITLICILCFPFILFSQSKPAASKEEEMIKVKKLQDILSEEQTENKKPSTALKNEKENIKDDNDLEQKKLPEKKIDQPKINTQTPNKNTKDIPFENPSEKFNGKLSNSDIFLEKQKTFYYLWIRKKAAIQSVALISYDKVKHSLRKYYLRSSNLIPSQAENEIQYKNALLGNQKNLFFLASSKIQRHPVLGSAFRIIIPSNAIYGYHKKSSKKSIYGTIPMIAGKTRFIIKTFAKKYANGDFVENFYTLEDMKDLRSNSFSLKLLKKKKGSNKYVYQMLFVSPYLNLFSIKLQNKNKELTLLESPNRPIENNSFGDNLKLLSWYYSFDKSCFITSFELILPKTNTKNLILKVETHSGSITYPLQ